MSYDVQVVPKGSSESWADAFDRPEARLLSDISLSADRRAMWEGAVERLMILKPSFERFDGDGFIELTVDEAGLQVTMNESEAAVSVAYWHDGDSASDMAALVGQIVEVLKAATGWSAWDPQLQREIESAGDLIVDGSQAIKDMSALLTSVASKPRTKWQFWKR